MLVSLEEAREYLRIDEGDTSNDDVILSSLETAQALCLGQLSLFYRSYTC